MSILFKKNKMISLFLPIGELATEKSERENSDQEIRGKINLHTIQSRYIEIN